jgi:hypothetical protein
VIVLTFPLDQDRVELEFLGWGLVMSAGAEPARGSSAGAAVVLRNSIGERYPSAECGGSAF